MRSDSTAILTTNNSNCNGFKVMYICFGILCINCRTEQSLKEPATAKLLYYCISYRLPMYQHRSSALIYLFYWYLPHNNLYQQIISLSFNQKTPKRKSSRDNQLKMIYLVYLVIVCTRSNLILIPIDLSLIARFCIVLQ